MDGEVVRAGCIVWGAGVRASPAATWLGVEADRAAASPSDRTSPFRA